MNPARPIPLRESLPILRLLVRRDFETRYAGSTLGVLWNIIHPVVLIGVYLLVFSHLMKGRAGADGGTTLDYAVHLCAGIVPWFLFSEVISRGTTVLTDNANFLSKLNVRPEILHLSVLINALIVNAVSYVILALLLLVSGVDVTPSVIFILPVMVLFGIMATGLAMILSVLHLVARDTSQLVQVALQFLFWLTPIVYYYSAEVLPETVMKLLRLNPVLPFVSLSQRLFGSPGHAFSPELSWHALFVLPVLFVMLGTWFLDRRRSEILDAL